jgi:hypothetical protein
MQYLYVVGLRKQIMYSNLIILKSK